MAKAFQCDRCNAFYKQNIIKKDNSVILYDLNLTADSTPLVIWHGSLVNRELNLCPDCIRKFVQFMKNEEEKKDGASV